MQAHSWLCPWCLYQALSTKWHKHSHVHVCMTSVSTVKSNSGINLVIVGGWNPSSAAFPPRWVLMEGCEHASTCRFPGCMLHSVYLEWCLKLPGVRMLPVWFHSHMGHRGSANIAHLYLGQRFIRSCNKASCSDILHICLLLFLFCFILLNFLLCSVFVWLYASPQELSWFVTS